jgi:4-methyl-5(b-hydroxyethyl)-thiazole monophosphate biosynthesis
MKKVLLVLIEGFEFYEASVFIDVIGWNLVDGTRQTELRSCGLRREVRASFGQTMLADHLVADIDAGDWDVLAVPGGFEEYGFYGEGHDPRILGLVRDFAAQGKLVASICVGSLIVAKAGVLAGRKATTYNQKPIRQESLRALGAVVLDEPVVEDGNFISCWNPSTAMEVAFRVLERLEGEAAGHHIRRIMGFAPAARELRS